MSAPANAGVLLEALAQRKARLEEELREVEKQVYNLETSYLNDSSTHGNVLKGFEGFLGPAKTQKCGGMRSEMWRGDASALTRAGFCVCVCFCV
jgi:hypothetical protein